MRRRLVTLALVAGCTATPGPAPGSTPPPTTASSTAAVPGVVPAEASEPTPLPEAASPGQGFRAPVVEAVRITTTTDVAVTLTRADDVAPWSGTVRYTAEPFTVSGRPQKGFVRERNVLGSGRGFDLNGDGDTRDRFAAGCDGDAFALGKTLRLSPVMGGPNVARRYTYSDSGQSRFGTIAEGGVSSMLYLPCTEDGVSLGWAPEPIEVREIQGPALMVLAFGNPKLPPALPADGVRREPKVDGLADQRFDVSVFEPVGEGPLWYAVAGAMVQIDPEAKEQTIRVFFDGDVEAVQIAVNEGRDGVDRARTYVSTQVIGSR